MPPTQLLLTEIFPPARGGSARLFWELYRRLPRERFLIAAGHHEGDAAFDASHGVPVERLPVRPRDTGALSRRGFGDYLRLARAVARICHDKGVERIHCGRCIPEGWVAWMVKQMRGTPYLCWAHGEEVNLDRRGETTGVMTSRQHRWMAGRVFKGAEGLLANSHNTARILTSQWGVPNHKIRVIHPGVDTARFSPPTGPGGKVGLGWEGRTVVLTVGRLQRRKGQDHMIRALPELRSAIPDILYVIAGDGPERQRLGELAGELGVEAHVRFAGEPDDEAILEMYRCCDLFALPNRQIGTDIEGFGMVLLEAQACGAAVLAGASGGTAEAVSAPETGVVVPCDEPSALAKLVGELLSDEPRLRKMGRAGREWVLERFAWDAVAARAESMFLKVGAND